MSIDTLIQQYSRDGDDRVLTLAWKHISSEMQSPDASTWLQAAWLAQAEHKFELALEYVEKSLKLKPRQARALLLKANTALVIGKTDLAEAACKQTTGLVDLATTQSCLARITRNKVVQKKALNRLKAWPINTHDAQQKAWIIETIAILATATGDLNLAEKSYRDAIALIPTAQRKAAYADVLIAQDRYSDVLTLIDASVTNPALAIRHMIAAHKKGLDIRSKIEEVDHNFRHWYHHSDFRHAREMAMFYIFLQPNPALAKQLAQHNLKIQREPIDKRILSMALAL